jgi:TRAP transporter TAXI family solute receptor
MAVNARLIFELVAVVIGEDGLSDARAAVHWRQSVDHVQISRMEELMKTRTTLISTTAFAVIAAIGMATVPPADAQQRKSVRWSTSSVDSYGYQVAAAMTKIAEDALGGEYTVTVNPYPSTTGAMKAAMDGNGEIGYTADVGMTQLYAGEGGFKNYTPAKGKMVHTWYAYPMESFMAVPADKASQYKCLKDLSGKPTFFTPAGFMNWLNFQRMYKALGYDFKHVQIDPKTQSDALKGGTVAASVAYTTSGRSLVPYWKETEIRMDLKIVNPCPDEVAKLKAAGLSVTDVDPNVFAKDVGVKAIQGVPILFGYNVRADMPEDVVYKLISAFYNNRDALAKADPGFGPGQGFCRHASRRHQCQPECSGTSGSRQVLEGAKGLERKLEDFGR